MNEDWFDKDERELVLNAIVQAESITSGELRLHLDGHCPEDSVLDRAAHLFAKLKMHETRERNGVLVYIAIEDHQFAVIGDVGINAKVPQGFWESTTSLMAEHFKAGDLVTGVCKGIEEAGIQLAKFFPIREDDTNELSNEISYGE